MDFEVFLPEKFYSLKQSKINFCFATTTTTKTNKHHHPMLPVYVLLWVRKKIPKYYCYNVLWSCSTSTNRCFLCKKKKERETSTNLWVFHTDIISCVLAQLKHMCSNLFPVSPGGSAWAARWSDLGRLAVAPHPSRASWSHLEGREVLYNLIAQMVVHVPTHGHPLRDC